MKKAKKTKRPPAKPRAKKADIPTYVTVRLPSPTYNVLAEAAKIAQMEQAEICLALVAIALAQAKDRVGRVAV